MRAGVRLAGFADALQGVEPPPDLADVHATLISAIRMASHAMTRRRLSVASGSQSVAAEASSAAAGALLLAAQARDATGGPSVPAEDPVTRSRTSCSNGG